MRKTKALAIAKRLTSSGEELLSASGQYVEVDRLLAQRPDASDELLAKLGRGAGRYDRILDIEVCAAILNHSNVSLSTFKQLAVIFPDAALRNHRILMQILADESAFNYCRVLLEHPACPIEWIERVFELGSYPLMLMTLQNVKLPKRFRQRLSSKEINLAAVSCLKKLEIHQQGEHARRYIKTYRKMAVSLPFAIPVFSSFDGSNLSHRLEDQVLFGFPFTSNAWPWPQDELGQYLQPISQIDLVNAGRVLGENLGDGLLQVWFSPNPSRNCPSDWEPKVRVVPRSDLNDSVDDHYPENAPWNLVGNQCIFNLGKDRVPSPRVQWVPLGDMYPRPHLVLQQGAGIEPKISDVQSEEYSKLIEKSGIPCMEGEFLDLKSSSVHLGGYVLGYGNEDDLISWEDQSNRLLFYVSDGFFTLVVTYVRNSSGRVVFQARLSCDH